MKYIHEIVGTHGGALLPERAPGAGSGSKTPRVYRPLCDKLYNYHLLRRSKIVFHYRREEIKENIAEEKKIINLWARIGLHSWAYDMDTQFWQPPIDHIHGYPILKDVGWRWPTQLFANINMHVWYSSPLLSTISALPPSECMRFTLGQVTWLLNEKENPWRLPIFYKVA